MLLFGNPTLPALFAAFFAIGIGMTVHEFAHNYVGHMMGDPVPAREGRLTLNPLVHINWIGWLMFALIGFGILGSAPISPYRMRNPRWGFLAAVVAGPISNLLVAATFAVPMRILLATTSPATTDPGTEFLFTLLQTTILLNVLLFVFNILPFFPLDGWHIVLTLLPPDMAYWWQSKQQISYYVFLGAILLSFTGIVPIFSLLITQPMITIYRFLIGA